MKMLLSYGLVGRGGDAVQVLEMAEALRNLGHTVQLVGPEALRPYEFGTGTSKVRTMLRRLPWWGKDVLELGLNRHLLGLACRAVRKERYDLLLHRASIYDFVGPWLAATAEVPLVAHLDAPFALERAFRGVGHFGRLHRRCMRRLGERARLVVTVSVASQDYYVSQGIPPEKILVLPNGIPSRLLQVGDELARAHSPLADSHVCTIGFVGSLSRWHRADLLLQALSQLEEGQYRLRVVGYGAEYPRLRTLANKLGMENRVSWLGAMPHAQAVGEIARFDIAVLPGTLSTGAPMKLFEYAAVARPTVAPDLPNLRSLFTDEEMWFVEPENPQALAKAILNLADDPERARTMGLKAQARVQREYTWEKIAQRILDAVQSRDSSKTA